MKIIGQKEFPPLEIGASEYHRFNLTRHLLKDGLTITAAEWSSIPSGLTFTEDTFTDYVVTSKVDTALAASNENYLVVCTVTKSDGTIRKPKARMRVLGVREID